MPKVPLQGHIESVSCQDFWEYGCVLHFEKHRFKGILISTCPFPSDLKKSAWPNGQLADV